MEAPGVIVIPARKASTRLPNKLLLRETGSPLLAHVIDNCVEAVRRWPTLFSSVVVAVDDPELLAIARQSRVEAVLTGTHHLCGTTRIAEAVETLGLREKSSFVVNVQGDEPELSPSAIERVANTLVNSVNADMATLVIAMPIGTAEQKANPNAVKAILDKNGRALYFTRAAAPFDRNPVPSGQPLWHHHLGVYAYRTEFLMEFASWPASPLEMQESLEQLRALDAGRTIVASAIPESWAGKGIDTPQDYADFVARFARRAA